MLINATADLASHHHQKHCKRYTSNPKDRFSVNRSPVRRHALKSSSRLDVPERLRLEIGRARVERPTLSEDVRVDVGE